MASANLTITSRAAWWWRPALGFINLWLPFLVNHHIISFERGMGLIALLLPRAVKYRIGSGRWHPLRVGSNAQEMLLRSER